MIEPTTHTEAILIRTLYAIEDILKYHRVEGGTIEGFKFHDYKLPVNALIDISRQVNETLHALED